MADEVEIRALYGELQGILAQTPMHRYLNEPEIWERFNKIVMLLNEATDKKFDRFLIKPQRTDYGFEVDNIIFRQALNGLINQLHARYFHDEDQPFSGSRVSSVSVSTNVSQSQAVYFQMILDFQSAVDKKVNALSDDSKEKQWWEKVKGSLGTVSSLSQLIATLIKTAQECGLTIEQLKGLFA